MAGDDDQDHDDHGDTNDVPPHRDAVEQGQQAVPEDVDHQPEEQQEHEQRHHHVRLVLHVDRGEVEDEVHVEEAEQVVDELRADVVHRGDDRDEADQVEPAGEPTPPGAAELRGPVVDPARRRHRGGELGHRERDAQDQDGDHRPADRDRDRTAVVERLAVGREAAGEHADDRERDREVGEAAPAAIQLLLVAKLGEALLVCAKTLIRRHSCSPLEGNGVMVRP